MLLVISFQQDEHANLVEAALKENNLNSFLRIDFEELDNLSYHISGSTWSLTDRSTGLHITPDNIRTVWWRRSGQSDIPKAFQESFDTNKSEAYWSTRWLIESLPHAVFPFGHPWLLKYAENKILQLRIANSIGFKIPASCISNNSETMVSFCDTHNEIVVKPLFVNIVRENETIKSLYAHAMPSRDLIIMVREDDGIGSCLFLQEKIEKSYDVRAFFLPSGSYYACSIDNSTLNEGEVDWRPTTMNHAHERIELPNHIARLCREFMNKMSLSSGSFDFGVTTTGDYIFFECNPNGQWLWMEIMTGYEIARMVADSLITHYNGSRDDKMDCPEGITQ